MRSFCRTRFWTLGGWFTWVAVAVGVGSAVIGGTSTVIGAKEQADASKSANAANAAAVSNANNQNWTDYLLQRGISTGSTVPAGTLPQSNSYQVENTKLPLWASINTPNTLAGVGGTSTLGPNGTNYLGSALAPVQPTSSSSTPPTVSGYAPRGAGTLPSSPTSTAQAMSLRRALTG